MLTTAPGKTETKRPNPEFCSRVLAVLYGHNGKANAIKGMEIAARLGLRSDRAVQLAILSLIEDGEAIASSCSEDEDTGARMGYYYPVTEDEAQDYIAQLRGRALGDYHRYKKFKGNWKRKKERVLQLRFGITQPVLFN